MKDWTAERAKPWWVEQVARTREATDWYLVRTFDTEAEARAYVGTADWLRVVPNRDAAVPA